MKNLIILFLLFTGLANGQTITLSSAIGTDNQTVCANSPIVNISYTTTGATGASAIGLPTGITGVWAANVYTISGTSTTSGVFNYTVTTTGGSGSVTANGTINVIPNNTATLSSATGTDNQTVCNNNPIINISYNTTGATGATAIGLPTGITGVWAANVYTISGTSTTSGVFNYTVTTTGGCGAVSANGTITIQNQINAGTIMSASSTISLGQAMQLNASIAGGTWSVSNSAIASINTTTGILTGISCGTVLIVYTLPSNGVCPAATSTTTVVVSNTATLTSATGTNNQTVLSGNPIVNITYATTGATGMSGITFSPAGLSGITVSMSGNVITISGTATSSLSSSTIFTYTVSLTGGCGNSTITGNITVIFPAGPATATPATYAVCDTDTDGAATFNLQTQDSSILNGQSQSQFMVTYHETFTDAQNNFNQISNPSTYINTLMPYNQTLYVRVTEFANPTNFATTTLQLIVNIPPAANTPPDMTVVQTVFTGFAQFDLTTQNPIILNGNPTFILSYHVTQADANANVNTISSTNTYTNTTNPQRIWYRVQSPQGCFTVSSFLLRVTNPNIVYIPDANFKTKLIALGVDTNTDGEIQFSEALVPTSLDVSNSNIADMTGIEAFVNLTNLNCNYNHTNNLNVLNCTNLYNLRAKNNSPLLNINLSGLAQLNILDISNDNPTITVNPATLNISGCTALTYLNASNKNLSALNLSSCIVLQHLDLNYNHLSSINLLNHNVLAHLFLNYNDLTTLDLSNNIHLNELELSSNNQLTSLFIKNGVHEILNLNANPNLTFICADDTQVAYIHILVPIATVSSYCTFTPGGPFNTISGTSRFDANNNGCDATDPVFKNLRVNINDGTNSGSTFTNGLGVYSFYTQQPNYTLTPWLENPTYFNVSPTTATLNFPANNGSTQTQNFCVSANGVHNDLEIILSPIGAARPGFDANYQLVYKNKGNQTLSGTINLLFDDARTDFVSANPSVNLQTMGSLSFNYSNLAPFEVRTINIIMNNNTPLETPPLNGGDVLNFTATINPVTGDDLPVDNEFNYNQIVVNSYDPNDKTCLEGTTLSPTKIGEYLHYNINFENTGSADAINVVVKDVIDTSMFEMNTLQVISASHDLKTEIKSNQVEFIFKNINLRHNPRGHGNVLFKIRTKPNLVVGSEVANTANIYFDYNAPIITNEARTIFQSLSTGDFETDNSVSIYPNPASDFVNIKCNSAIKSVQLFDVQGRIIQTIIENKSTTKIDISNQSNGIYFLKITTDEGVKVERVVRG